MASLVWTSVYLFLLGELALTAILVVPVPRRVRNAIAKRVFQFQLGERLSKPILFIGLALLFALMESYFRRSHIVEKISMLEESEDFHHGHISSHHHEKEKKYKAERNLYLSGFALTLIFVIGRITALMEENVELDHEAHPPPAAASSSKPSKPAASKGSTPAAAAAATTTGSSSSKNDGHEKEIEMVEPKKTTEKKND
eukprot:scaffold16300_cov150-Cylindrotheca_fusiformis.AAC.6